MNTRFDDIKRQAQALPFEQKAALARVLIEELDHSVDADTEQFPLTSHVGPHDLVIAARYDKIINKNAFSVAGAAKETKKSKTVIRDRVRLNQLEGEARKALRDRTISMSVAGLILRVPGKKQRAKFTKEVLHQYGEPMSFRKAKKWKEQHYMKELKGASFPLDDATLDPAWGYTCLNCPHYKGNTSERQQGKRADICLKPEHYTKLVGLNAARTTP